MVRRRWRLAVVLGLIFAVILGFFVFRAEPATPGPEGLALAWAVLWRGVAYGAAGGLLLSTFPILAVLAEAVVAEARRRGLVLSRPGEAEEEPGRGDTAVGGRAIGPARGGA